MDFFWQAQKSDIHEFITHELEALCCKLPVLLFEELSKNFLEPTKQPTFNARYIFLLPKNQRSKTET